VPLHQQLERSGRVYRFLQFTLEIGNNNGVLLMNFAPESIPEPSSLVLAGTVALVGLGVRQWRRRD
jgi:hypothetical protein